MKKIYYFLLTFIVLGLVLTACNPISTTPPTPAEEKGSMQIEWKHFVGNDALILNTGQYTTALGEPFTVTLFKYYISNIKFKKADGTYYTYPKDNSYFLIKANDAASQISLLNDIPAGDYTGIEFVLGVDSVKNYSTTAENTGALAPVEGMFWTWNTGYIFWKYEGTYTYNGNTDAFTYHIAGAGRDAINNVRQVSIPFDGSKLTIKSGTKPELHIKTDVSKIFNGDPNVEIHSAPSVQDFSKVSGQFATNASKMFSFITIH